MALAVTGKICGTNDIVPRTSLGLLPLRHPHITGLEIFDFIEICSEPRVDLRFQLASSSIGHAAMLSYYGVGKTVHHFLVSKLFKPTLSLISFHDPTGE